MTTEQKRAELIQDVEAFGYAPHHCIIGRDAASSADRYVVEQIENACPAQIDEYFVALQRALGGVGPC